MNHSPYPRGNDTAFTDNARYRVAKLTALGIVRGRWLDLGCAGGGYLEPLRQAGAEEVVGADVEPDRVAQAAARFVGDERITLVCVPEDLLPFADGEFDGCLLNEVLEHTLSDAGTLAEVLRVLRPGGCVAVMSPNRLFPLEGHGARLGTITLRPPIPVVHWLPARLRKGLIARVYTPGALARVVALAGFRVVRVEPVLPVFERWRVLPAAALPAYRRIAPALEKTPILRSFVSVSTLVVGRKPPLAGSHQC